MQFFVKDVRHNVARLKGKGISEFGKNLESEGWPSEFANEEVRDRVKFAEKKEGRPIRRGDLPEPEPIVPKYVEGRRKRGYRIICK